MKKITILKKFKIISVITLVLLITISCNENDLELKNPTQFTSETFFKTPEEIVQSANSTYISFFYNSIGGYQWPEIWDVLGNETEATAGALGSKDEIPIIQMQGYLHNETNDSIGFLWRVWYKMILRANLTIKVADEYLAKNKSNDDVIRSRGEAYFLRGLAYFNLAFYWGKVPLRKNFDQSSNINAPLAATIEEVWAVSENDFKEAQLTLKTVKDYPADQLGRATKGAATGFLGKLYLYTGKYALAETELSKLEGDYGLLPKSEYFWNFGEINENNTESVFEFQSAHNGSAFIWGPFFEDPEGGVAPGMNNAQPQLHSWNGWLNWKFPPRKEQVFIYDDEGGQRFIDPRGAETFYGGTAGDDTWCDLCPGNPKRSYNFAELGYIYKKKSNREIKEKESGNGADFLSSGNNIRLMRYADVLLMRAECALELGDISRCIGFINQVRRRFNIFEYTPGLYSKTQAFELLKRERSLEFMGEGSRFNDLKRWGILEQTLNPEFQELYNTQPVEARHYFFPIPQGERDTNLGI